MAALQVSAEIVAGVASPGLAGPAFAAVSVTNLDGAPLSLDENKFRFTVIATPGGVPEAMTHRLNTPRDDGFHLFSLFPRTGHISERWGAGDYLVGIQVNDPSGRGQTLGVLHVPPRSVSEEPAEQGTATDRVV
jgi:hypothetical protein